MKAFLRVLLALGTLLLLILLIIAVNTARFESKQLERSGVANVYPIDYDAVDKLAGAIRIPTVSYDDPALLDTTAFLAMLAYLDDHFPLAGAAMEKTIINSFTVIYHWKGKVNNTQPSILYAHLDVVPIEEVNRDEWLHDPWSGDTAQGYLWGRGALDNKGSMIAMLVAAERLLDKGFTPDNDVYFIFGHDEEVGGPEGAGHAAKYLESRGITTKFNLDEGGPCSHGMVPFVEGAVLMLGTAEKGYVTLQLTAKVKGGHSSKPEKVTSTGVLVQALARLEKYKFPQRVSPVMQDFMAYAGPEMGLPYKAIFANTWLFKPLILKAYQEISAEGNALTRTTFAITLMNAGVKENTIPGEASAKVNFRILTGESVASVVETVKKVIDDERIDIEIIRPIEPSPVTSTASYGFKMVQEVGAKIFPDAIVSPFLMLGGTDSKHFEKISESLVRCQPVRMDAELLRTIHGVNERIGIHDYMEMIAFYEEIIQRI
jgi:carboxypeptidase PM20D1